MKKWLLVTVGDARWLPLAAGFLLGVPMSGQAQQATAVSPVDTLLAQNSQVVVSAVASALALQGMLGGNTDTAVATSAMGVLSRATSAGIRTASMPLDSLGLAQNVLPGANRYIGAAGGRYVFDVIISVVESQQTRLRIVPLFIAIVPGSNGPLGGRPLPSAGVVERQILDNIMARLTGN